MSRLFALTLVIGATTICTGGLAARTTPETGAAPEARTMTGWFADAQCAAPRVAKGIIAPNNPDCVKKCLREGVAPVFLSQQAKAMYEVRGYPSVAEDVGWHVEVVGTIDEAGKTIAITSVKRLEEEGAMCALPRKAAPKAKGTS